jgi:malate synthase
MRSAIKILESGYEDILTPKAVAFITSLVDQFEYRIHWLMQERRFSQARFDAGETPDFLSETQSIRQGAWKVASLPYDLHDRRVEITGPVDRKMIINALNSGAQVFMADFEDSTTPTWENLLTGQRNLIEAVAGTISFEDPSKRKQYTLNPQVATLFVRPRGWHLPEKHVEFEGQPISGSLFDFGLYFFHNVRALIEKGTAPYFYLPKIQSYLEARLWNDVFVFAQQELGIPLGTIKATVLIETLPAAFQMDEILYELKAHSAGLNCGRWDYIFSFIKTLRRRSDYIMPERSEISMLQPCMRAYTQLVIKTCHNRGVHAIGGMAAQIPIRDDAEHNARALQKVRADKLREVLDGHDGTWVAHPGLVPLAREIFDAHMPTANQISRRRDDVQVNARQLLQLPQGKRTESGLRQNINVGVQYLASWLAGAGCVPLYNLMEDAATCEISRTQLWQWLRYGAAIEMERGSVPLTKAEFVRILTEEVNNISAGISDKMRLSYLEKARRLFAELSMQTELPDFLTLPAYKEIP